MARGNGPRGGKSKGGHGGQASRRDQSGREDEEGFGSSSFVRLDGKKKEDSEDEEVFDLAGSDMDDSEDEDEDAEDEEGAAVSFNATLFAARSRRGNEKKNGHGMDAIEAEIRLVHEVYLILTMLDPCTPLQLQSCELLFRHTRLFQYLLFWL